MADEISRRAVLVATDLTDPWNADYEQSIGAGVQEFYGPKINFFYTDREARLAFGTAYPRISADGSMGFEPRYQVAVFFPVQTAKDLYVVLRAMLKATGQLPPDAAEDPPIQHH